jgi:hypothetical protein
MVRGSEGREEEPFIMVQGRRRRRGRRKRKKRQEGRQARPAPGPV